MTSSKLLTLSTSFVFLIIIKKIFIVEISNIIKYTEAMKFNFKLKEKQYGNLERAVVTTGNTYKSICSSELACIIPRNDVDLLLRELSHARALTRRANNIFFSKENKYQPREKH